MDHHERLAWAGKHLDALEQSVRDFANNKPCRLVRDFNTKTHEHIAKVVDVKPTPPDWSLRVGDAVHGMRSALDNIVYALAVKESGVHAADCNTRLQFPICDTPQGWMHPKKGTGQIDRVTLLSLAAQTEIERLQPYNRADQSNPSFLAVLRDLDNTDKHRRLILTVVKGMDVELTLTGTGIPAGYRVKSGFRGRMVENTPVASWTFDPPRTPSDMEVHGDLMLDVEFGDGERAAPRQSVRNILRYIHGHIASDVFAVLDPLLV